MKVSNTFRSSLTMLLLMVASVFIYAQAPYLQWSVSYGGNNDDYPAEVLVLEDGYLIGGKTKSFGNQNDKYDFYLIKTDDFGNIIWSKTYGGVLDEHLASLSQAQDGGYILSGSTSSFASGIADGYIVRVDKDGDTLWTKNIGNETTDQFYCGIPTRDQGFVFTGFSSVYLKGDQVYIVKTDASGDTLWTQTQGGDHQDYGYCILEDITSGYASLGHSWSYTGYESMGYLVRLNDDGNVTWWNAFGDTGEDYARWFDQNPDHSFNIVGSTQSYGNGMDDFWLVFTNPDGTPVSWFTYGGSGADICYNGSRDVDGGFLMAGHTWSFGLDAPNMFLVKADANGDSLWAVDWGDQDWEYAWDIKPTFDGGYVLLGRDYSISSGDNNIVLVKYGPHPSIYNTLERRNDLSLPIEDEQSTHNIIDLSVAPASTVSGVTVYVDTIMHGQIRDLVITLSHGGVTDTLLLNPQAGGANMLGTVFHPAAGCDAQAGIAPMSGMYRPYGPTIVFNNTNVNGPWELRIHDTQAGNTGTLEAWGIQVYYEGEVGLEEGPDLETNEVELYVYPNPASDKLYCKIVESRQPGPSVYMLEVLDLHGKMLKLQQLHNTMKPSGIDISDLPKGLYFIKLSVGANLLATQKFMIAR